MKKRILFALFLLIMLVFVISSCGKQVDNGDNSESSNENDSKYDGHTHIGVVDNAVTPTCVLPGLKAGLHCSVCNEIIVEQEIIPAKGHVFENGISCANCFRGTSEGFQYKLNEDERSYTIVGIGSCQDTDVVIPFTYSGFPVTAISESAFKNCSHINSITVVSNVLMIGESAFSGCNSLKSITLSFIGASKYGSVNEYFGYIFGAESLEDNGKYIPSSLKTVIITNETSINASAFKDCSSITSVTLRFGTVSIGASAFEGCSNLRKIEIPGGVTSIEDNAFKACSSLKNIELPSGIKSIGIGVFAECNNLQSMTIPFVGASMTSSDGYFGYFFGAPSADENDKYVPSALKEVVIFNGTTIASKAFKNCDSIISVTIPSTVTVIGSGAFSGCGSLQSITLPFIGAESNGTNNTHFGYIFGASSYSYNSDNVPSSLKTVIINGNDRIDSNAFYNCSSIISVTIGSGVTSIGDNAFGGCYRLIEVYNLSSLNIEKGSKDNGSVGLYALNIYTSAQEKSNIFVTNDGYIFYESGEVCYLIEYQGTQTDLILPKDCNGKPYEIHKYTFYKNKIITSIIIPDGITSIYDAMFYECSNLTSVTIGNGVTTIGEMTFYKCSSLTSITIPDSVTIIGSYAFYDCDSLKSVTIGNGVTSIGAYAFYGCRNLTSATIGNGVISIGYFAFYGCNNLQYNEYDNALYLGNSENPYYVLIKAKNTNITSCNINENTGIIFGKAFYECLNLTSITIPNSVTSIGDSSFYGCSNLTSVTIGNSVTSISDSSFYGCSSLTSITIPNSVTSIGYRAFYSCIGLTSVTIGKGVESIGSGAFTLCNSLNAVYIEDLSAWCKIKFTVIDDMGFSSPNPLIYAHNLYLNNQLVTDLVIPDGITEINDSAFSGCTSITSITIPNSVTSIGIYAFNGCTNLTSATIGNGVTSIGEYAFYRCSSLTSINIPNSVKVKGSWAFSECNNLTNAVFENTSDWYIDDYWLGGSALNLTDPSTAAEYLRDYYGLYRWKCK